MSKWDQFVRKVGAIQEQLDFQQGEECFFRGVADSRHDLTPSLFLIATHAGREDCLLTLEYDLFFEFKARAKELQHGQLDDWEWLFQMRHHGLPTRLLDWTEAIGVAVYFALDGLKAARPTTPRLWILNPYALNELAWDDRDLMAPKYLGWDPDEEEFWTYEEILLQRDPEFEWDYPVAIYPNQKAHRMHSQRGWFTIHGDDPRPLNKILTAEEKKKILNYIDLDPGTVAEAREFLDFAGINAYSLFPDLDGLSKELHHKYGISYAQAKK